MPGRRILYLSRWWPEPADNGIRLRVRSQIEALAREHEIRLLSFVEPGHEAVPSADLRRLCGAIETLPWRPFDPSSLRALMALAHPTPRSLVDVFSPAMRDAVARQAGSADLVIASSLDLAEYSPWFGGRAAILEDLELAVHADAVRHGSVAARARAWLTWSKLVRHVRRILARFSACTVPSVDERRLAERVAPEFADFHVVVNAVDTRACAGVGVATPRAPRRLVFAGALTYGPNLEAMRWFVGDILPRVRKLAGDVELLITGVAPREGMPIGPGVRPTGWVEDVRAVVASAAVSIAPVRHGSGTRLKILEAMALGTPVVATSKAAEGLEVVDGEHLLLADDAATFAAQTVRLLGDRDLASRLAEAARQRTIDRYDTEVAAGQLRRVVDRALSRIGATAGRPT